MKSTGNRSMLRVERRHKFAKHLAFGAGGHLRSNNPADQGKAIVYNDLLTNAVALQNVLDQTQALHALKSKGVSVHAADLACLNPYATSKLKRFGDYPTDLKPESMPTCTTLTL
jgi:hypothetical protein